MTGRQRAACAAVLAAFWLTGDAAGSWQHYPATRATGVPTWCYHPWEWGAADGIYDRVNRAIYLTPRVCGWLRRLHAGDPRLPMLGLMTLGHERAHHHGVRDHWSADCRARRRVGVLARAMGATWPRSQALRREALRLSLPCPPPR